ncbi:MAG: alpha/beta fold hydrolase [Motiliproteus sp.]
MSLYIEQQDTYIEQQGNPDGQPLVLLHGWGMLSDIWHDWLPALTSDYRLLLVDLPGLGRSRFCTEGGISDDGTDGYSLEAVAQQIIDATGPLLDRPAVWLGWSLGGLVAANIVANPELPAAGLITIATNPCFVERADWPEAMSAATFALFQQSLQQTSLKTLNRFAALQGQGDPQARALLRTLKPVVAASAAQSSHLAQSLALLGDDQRSLFADLTLPRLALFGENDALVPVAVAKQPLLSPYARIIDEAGHVPFITASTALTTHIKQWLEGLPHG